MSWLKRSKKGLKTGPKAARTEVADGLWIKCPSCGEGNNLQVLYESQAGIDVLRFLERA